MDSGRYGYEFSIRGSGCKPGSTRRYRSCMTSRLSQGARCGVVRFPRAVMKRLRPFGVGDANVVKLVGPELSKPLKERVFQCRPVSCDRSHRLGKFAGISLSLRPECVIGSGRAGLCLPRKEELRRTFAGGALENTLLLSSVG